MPNARINLLSKGGGFSPHFRSLSLLCRYLYDDGTQKCVPYSALADFIGTVTITKQSKPLSQRSSPTVREAPVTLAWRG